MGKKLELTGKRFGKLTVLKEAGKTNHGKFLWNCICECGKEKVIIGTSLTRKNGIKSCGCYRPYHIKDLTGKNFGRLTVLKQAKQLKKGIIRWNCICECGKEKVINGQDLKTGNTKSCGCMSKENSIKLGKSRKNSSCNKNEINGMWKGDNATLPAIHAWIRRRKTKPEYCEFCKIYPPYDLANISQKYHRDINDFEWLCRRCHMIKDGRLHKHRKGDKMISSKKFVWECIVCNKKVISEVKPEICICSNNGQYVLNGNLIVTKSPQEKTRDGVNDFITK